MANAIVTNVLGFTTHNRSKIYLTKQKKEFSMVNGRSLLDHVSPRQRKATPFSYRWLKFKTGFLGLVLLRGNVQ